MSAPALAPVLIAPAPMQHAHALAFLALAACSAACSAAGDRRAPDVHAAPARPADGTAPDPVVARSEAVPPQPERSYVVPALEIVAFEFLLNQFDRHLVDDEDYATDASTIEDNLSSGWAVDQDPFAVNQLGHPYAGSIYHGFARSAGLSYWVALGYDFAGSALWEVAGETTKPSANDQVSTAIGGSFLGEALFRTAAWILDPRRGGEPDFGRVVGAAAASPSATLNHFVLGDPHRPVDLPADPPVSTRVGLGVRSTTHLDGQGTSNAEERVDALFEFGIDYGHPGRTDEPHERPFDWFELEFAAQTDPDNHVDRAIVRGLLWGDDYQSGDTRGIWGLYGSYDYVSPGVFRVATTALSLGTTLQDRLSHAVTLQSTALAGVGFGPAGTVADDVDDRDYHFGAIPQASADVRLIFGERLALELCGRGYHVIGGAYDDSEGYEDIAQAEAALLVRIGGPHALRAAWTASWRDAHYDDSADQHQRIGNLTLSYAFLGGTSIGAGR